MKISGILWLDDIVDKLYKKHKVDTQEVVELLGNEPGLSFRFIEKGH